MGQQKQSATEAVTTEAMGNRSSQQQKQSARGAEKRRCNPSSTSFLSSPWLLLLLSNLRFQPKGQKSTFQRQGRETRQLCSGDKLNLSIKSLAEAPISNRSSQQE